MHACRDAGFHFDDHSVDRRGTSADDEIEPAAQQKAPAGEGDRGAVFGPRPPRGFDAGPRCLDSLRALLELLSQVGEVVGRCGVEPREASLVTLCPQRLERARERVVGHAPHDDVRRRHPIDEVAEHQLVVHLGCLRVRGECSRLTCEDVADPGLREHQRRSAQREPRAELVEVGGEVGAQLVDGLAVDGRPEPDARGDVVEQLRERRHRPSMPPSAVICAESYGAGTPRISRVTPSARRRSRCPLSSLTHRGESDALAVARKSSPL